MNEAKMTAIDLDNQIDDFAYITEIDGQPVGKLTIEDSTRVRKFDLDFVIFTVWVGSAMAEITVRNGVTVTATN